MKLILLILLFSTNAFAQTVCPQLYGKQNPGGDWSFADVKQSDMIPVESDANCRAQAGAYRTVDEKMVLDQTLLTAKLAAEAVLKDDHEKVDKKTIKALMDRVKALEDEQAGR